MTMKPPIGGPSTGPSIAGMVSNDMARTSSDLGTLCEQHEPPDRGPSSRPPCPATTRAATSSGRFCAEAAASELAA